ncbi:MAG TPA: hypothetical protein PKD77_11645 [Rudaea sp.]|jgi:hypothetical protein|nr:hypothetical protein [Rudaea sp.]
MFHRKTPVPLVAASTGAFGFGALAALLGACCGTPWLVGVVGVSGAIAIARAAFLAPYLWLLALVLAFFVLGWAYLFAPACEDECAASVQRGRRIAAWIIVLILAALFVATRGWNVLVFAG